MPPETKDNAEEKGNLPEEVTKVLEDIRAKLDNPAPAKEESSPKPTVPSYADQRAELQKRLKFDDQQMAAHEEMILKANAPVVEQTGWSRLEKRSDIDAYRAEIEKELAIYPQERRTPEVMEKIYFYVKGKHSDSKPGDERKPASGSRVVETKVSRGPGYTGSDPGMSGGARGGEGGGDPDEQLSDQEKFVAAKLGVTEKDYRDSKKVGREIRGLRVADSRPVSSMADVELRRMQSSR